MLSGDYFVGLDAVSGQRKMVAFPAKGVLVFLKRFWVF